MQVYKYNGIEISFDDIQKSAQENGLSVDDYIELTGIQIDENKIDENVFISTLQNYLDRPEGSKLIKSTVAPLVLGITRNLAGLAPAVEETDPFANEPLNDIFNDFYREISKGVAEGASLGPSLRLQEALKQGKEFNEEDIIKFSRNAAKINNLGTTDEARAYQKIYDSNKEKYNAFTAFFLALGENPTFALTTTTSSLARMGSGFVSDPKVRSEAIGKGIFAVGSAVAVGKPKLAPIAFMSSVFSSVGGSLEQATTFQEIIQEGLQDDSKDFTAENIKGFLNDKEVITFKSPRGSMFDITGTRAEIARKRAVKRGLAIETVDMFSTLLGGTVVRQMTKAGKTKKAIGAVGTTTAVGGGLTSETLGQLAGGQELEVGEILLEGIAEKAVAMTGITTVPELLKKRATYKLNGQTLTEQELLRELNKMSDVEIAEMQDQIEVKNDDFTKKRIQNRVNRGTYEARIAEKVTDKADRKLLAKKFAELDREKAKDRSKKKKDDVLSPFVEAQNDNIALLENQIKTILNKYQGPTDTKAFQERNKKIKLARLNFLKNEITEGVKKTKAYKKMDIDTEEVSADQAVEKFFAQEEQNLLYDLSLLNENLEQATDNKTKKEIRKKIKEVEAEYNSLEQNAQEARTAQGFLLEDNATGKMTIVINEDVALTDGININVAAHELLHAVLRNTFLTEKGFRAREAKGAGLQTGQSLLNYLLENKEGELLIDGGILNRLKSYENANSDVQGQEVLNLLSDAFVNTQYQSKAEGFLTGIGERISDILKAYLPEKYANQLNFTNGKQVFDFVKTFNKAIRGDKVANRIIERVSRRGIDVSENITKEETGRASKAPMSKAASDRVQSIYETKGVDGAFEIIEQFKPITTRLARRYRNVPGYDQDLLVDEIETGRRGIYDLITEYNPNSNVPLAAYINKFLPARAIEAADRILETEFTQDVSERTDIAAEETTVETADTPKPRQIKLADRLNISEKVEEQIGAAVATLNLDNVNFKNLKDLMPEITSELFGIPVKKLISGANLTKGELQSAQMFINKNADLLIKVLPEGGTASGTATGVPRTLLNEFYTKGERVKAAKTGSRAGLAVQEKKSITKKQFLEVFGIVDGRPQRDDRNTSARVLAMANVTGKMITNQAVREKLAQIEGTEQISQRLSDGKSSVMFSKGFVERLVDKPLNPKSGNNRNQMKIFLEKTFPKFLPPVYRSDSFGPRTSLEVNQKLGFFISAAERRSLQNKAKKVKNNLNIDQVNFINSFLIDKRNNFNQLNDKKFSETFENHWKGAEIYVQKLADMFHAGNSQEVVAILSTSARTSSHFVRIMGLPIGIADDVNIKKSASGAQVLINKNKKLKGKPQKEHVFQTSPATDFIALAISLDKKHSGAVKRAMAYLKKNYYVIGINSEDNAKVDADYSETQPKEFNDLYDKNAVKYLKGEVSINEMPDPVLRLVHPNVNVDISKYKLYDGTTLRDKYFGADNATIFKYLSKTDPTINEKYLKEKGKIPMSKGIIPITKAGELQTKARSVQFSKKARGMSTFDFDETLIIDGENFVIATLGDETIKVSSAQWPVKGPELMQQGYKFNFDDFVNVRGGVEGPLLQKMRNQINKFGVENVFVLTARPQAASTAIQGWLKSKGINIPLKNITGLGNSTAEAKAMWMIDKFSQGYNDMYFVDDALSNVKEVKAALEQLDIKSKVVQAKVQFSKQGSQEFNKILEEVKGVKREKTFSRVVAEKFGAGKGRYRFFVPPSHEDFIGLLYNFIGKGEAGNRHRKFFEDNLIKPLNKAFVNLNKARQAISNDYASLLKQSPGLRKKLSSKIPGTEFFYSDAVRVYLWDKAGFDIPGLSNQDIKELVETITSNEKLHVVADIVGVISRQADGYVQPNENWIVGDIRTDLQDATGRVGRAKFFNEFFENADIIFSEENLNKIEAIYGNNVREAIRHMLDSIKTGKTRNPGDKRTNQFLDYINGSVGATMFFNIRSMLLQQLSNINFINWGDNNIFKASAAFANQKQYWNDFAFLFNSDFLKQRRSGIAFDVNGNELAKEISKSKEPFRATVRFLLQKGFAPTQFGDSLAIAMGGATMYRNRVKTYIKQGLSKTEAQNKAFQDFVEVAESTQQSARMDMIGMQQKLPIGKILLAFQNYGSQVVRIKKKAVLDLINRRITPPYKSQKASDMANVSKIIHYAVVQNVLFHGLQTALFALAFSDDEEDKELIKTKSGRFYNGMVDTILRGTGIAGGVVSVLKNTAIKWVEEQEKPKWKRDKLITFRELLKVSPPLSIKERKISQADNTRLWDEDVMKEMPLTDLDNPIWPMLFKYVEGITNLPIDNAYQNYQNLKAASDTEITWWKRLALLAGWSRWDVGVEDKELEAIKDEVKRKKKAKKVKTTTITPF